MIKNKKKWQSKGLLGEWNTGMVPNVKNVYFFVVLINITGKQWIFFGISGLNDQCLASQWQSEGC